MMRAPIVRRSNISRIGARICEPGDAPSGDCGQS
jgi:hypothetical protein